MIGGAFSSKRLFIEKAFHRMACSSNAQFHLVFKTVSRISVALLHLKLLMIVTLKPITNSPPIWSQLLVGQMRGKGSNLGEGEKELSQVRGKWSKLVEPFPKVRLSQDRMPVEPFPSRISQVRGKGILLSEWEGELAGLALPKGQVKSGQVANRAISKQNKVGEG